MRKHLENLITELNQIKNGKEIYKFLIEHRGIFKLMIDNDDTFIRISDETLKSLDIDKYSVEADDINDTIRDNINNYIGWSDGIFELLDAIGIKAESV